MGTYGLLVMCGRRVGQEELALGGVAEDARDLEGHFATGYKTLQVPRIGKIAMVDVRLSPRIARDRLHDTLGFAVADLDDEPVQARHREQLSEHKGELDVVHRQVRSGPQLEGRPDRDEARWDALFCVDRD